MAGTMRFNLICNDRSIRTLEQLRDNFSAEEVLDYYNYRLLHGWLEARGYRDEWRDVNAIASDNPAEIMRELSEIFHVNCDEVEIKEVCVAPKSGDSMDELEREFQEYEAFESDILEHCEDWEFLRTCANELSTTFYEFFKKNYYYVIIYLSEKCPMFLYAMATNPALRPYMIFSEMPKGSLQADRKNIFQIDSLFKSDKFLNPDGVKKILQDNVRVVSIDLNGRPQEIISDRKIMIVGIENQGDSLYCRGMDGRAVGRYGDVAILPIINGLCARNGISLDYRRVSFYYLELDKEKEMQ